MMRAPLAHQGGEIGQHIGRLAEIAQPARRQRFGRNGAVGPDYFQIDMRAGYRRKLTQQKAIEVYFDLYNITNRANFDNPLVANSDRRLTANFLVLTNLRGGAARTNPDRPAAVGDYAVVADERLEDVCGNTILRPFDLDLTKPPRKDPPRTVSFRVAD